MRRNVGESCGTARRNPAGKAAPLRAIALAILFVPLFLGQLRAQASLTESPNARQKNDQGRASTLKMVFAHGYTAAGDITDFRSEIYVMNSDGTQVRNLKAVGGQPAFSPDGTKIAFVSSRDTDLPELFVMNADGSNVKRLTHEKDIIYVQSPTWSPDSGTIAFRASAKKITHIFLIDADGKNLRQLSDWSAIDPAWSPDGKEIAVSCPAPPNHLEICLIDADAKAVHQLTHLNGEARAPAWSPDGARIAFTFPMNRHWGIFWMHADGSDIRQFAYHKDFDFVSPTWLPGGRQIAFSAYEHHDPGGPLPIYVPPAFHHIWVMDVKSLMVRRMTRDSGTHPSFAFVAPTR